MSGITKYYKDKDGYLINTKTQKKQHREVMEPTLNALNELFPDETWVVHHVDGDKTNNDVLNLQIMKLHEHRRMHMTGDKPYSYYQKKHIAPWRRVWKCSTRYNGNKIYLGLFEDFLSCEIVAKLVMEEFDG